MTKLTKGDILFIVYVLVKIFQVCSNLFSDRTLNESKLDNILEKLDDMIAEESL